MFPIEAKKIFFFFSFELSLCIWRFGPLTGLIFTRRIHSTQHTAILVAMILYREQHRANQQRKRSLGQNWRKPSTIFQGSSLSKVIWDTLPFPSNKLWQHSAQGLYWDWTREHPLPGMYHQFRPRGKMGFWHKPCSWQKHFRHSEPLLSFRELWKHSWNLSSGYQSSVNMASRPFLGWQPQACLLW